MGISQSLISLGTHAYLIKGVQVDSNEDGSFEDYPFTINQITNLGRMKLEGQFVGAFAGAICFTSYNAYGNGKGTDVNILDISYRL
jgi:hypothetical protein